MPRLPLDHDCECICEECLAAVIAEHERLMLRWRANRLEEIRRRVDAAKKN